MLSKSIDRSGVGASLGRLRFECKLPLNDGAAGVDICGDFVEISKLSSLFCCPLEEASRKGDKGGEEEEGDFVLVLKFVTFTRKVEEDKADVNVALFNTGLCLDSGLVSVKVKDVFFFFDFTNDRTTDFANSNTPLSFSSKSLIASISKRALLDIATTSALIGPDML